MAEGRDDPDERRTVFGFGQGPVVPGAPSPITAPAPPVTAPAPPGTELPPAVTAPVGDAGKTLRQDPSAPGEGESLTTGSASTLTPIRHPTLNSEQEFDSASAVDSALADVAKPVPGQTLFDRYMVIKRLGEGGMGTVWLVRHLEFDSERALKLIVSGIAMNAEIRSRFRREARMMDRLNHPNSVRVYDVRLGGGTAFIEMEYIRGESLNHLVQPGEPMPLDQVTDLLDQLCDVLQAANDEGIIHRDLKPSNLMFVDSRVPGKKILKLLDFGIAKFRDGGEDDVTTQTGLFIGTAPYSSPEQIRGQAVDTRSDIYSVGILLFELLTGYRPFTGPSYSLIASHLSTPPPRFADRNQYADVPVEIEDVVLSCLAKDPAARPQTPRELAERFHRALEISRGEDPESETDEGWEDSEHQGSPATEHGTRSQPYAKVDAGTRYPELWDTVGPAKIPEPKKSGLRVFLLMAIVAIAAVAVAAAVWRIKRPADKVVSSETKQSVGKDPGVVAGPIEREVQRWLARGFKVDPKGGKSTEGWPNALVAADGNRFQLDASGLYLPAGYKPERGSESADQRPSTLTREDGTKFRRIDGGQFMMGCLADYSDRVEGNDPSKPAHPVILSSFYMQETEVTNGEIDRYARDSGSRELNDWKKALEKLSFIIGDKALKHPAVSINYQAAKAYAQKRGGRLPTEAQWEYAARSRGKDYLYVWDFQKGLGGQGVGSLARIDSAGDGPPTVAVGSYDTDATIENIKDLTGNVRELCRDVRKPYEQKPEVEVDPQFAPVAGEGKISTVVRGGSFFQPTDSGKTTSRGEPLPLDASAGDIGFRLVLECPELPSASAMQPGG